MSRYSRDFRHSHVQPAHGRDLPGYTRYQDMPVTAKQVACGLCDGAGGYESDAGMMACDFCDGVGRVAAERQNELTMFRSRSRRGE